MELESQLLSAGRWDSGRLSGLVTVELPDQVSQKHRLLAPAAKLKLLMSLVSMGSKKREEFSSRVASLAETLAGETPAFSLSDDEWVSAVGTFISDSPALSSLIPPPFASAVAQISSAWRSGTSTTTPSLPTLESVVIGESDAGSRAAVPGRHFKLKSQLPPGITPPYVSAATPSQVPRTQPSPPPPVVVVATPAAATPKVATSAVSAARAVAKKGSVAVAVGHKMQMIDVNEASSLRDKYDRKVPGQVGRKRKERTEEEQLQLKEAKKAARQSKKAKTSASATAGTTVASPSVGCAPAPPAVAPPHQPQPTHVAPASVMPLLTGGDQQQPAAPAPQQTSGTEELSRLLQGPCNQLTAERRDLIEKFLLGSKDCRAPGSPPVVQVPIHSEDRALPDGTLVTETIIFEVDYSTSSWKKLRKRTKRPKPQP